MSARLKITMRRSVARQPEALVAEVLCCAAYPSRNVVMGNRLEKFRAWLTPRKRLWTGIGLYALTIVVPAVSPGTSVSWLVGPAVIFFMGGFMTASGAKR
ncbi:hypothetical protein D3C80_1615600 [compost metagenome]